MRKSADLGLHLAQERDRFLGDGARVVVDRTTAQEPAQIENDGHEALARAVMEFPCNTPPLFILRTKKMRAEILHLVLRPPEFRDIGRNGADGIGLLAGLT